MCKKGYAVKESDMKRLAEYQRSLWISPELTILFFELTNSCNLNCRHCGSRCSSSNKVYLNTEVIMKVLSSVSEQYDPQRIMVALTGGEPLLHPDCLQIIRYAHDLHYSVGMTTNGTLIDSGFAYDMKNAGLDTVSVSIDGIGESHDRLRMVKGSFNKALEGIRCLKSAGIAPQVTTVVHNGNIDELEHIYDLIVGEDIYSWRLTNVDPIGRAYENADMLLDYDGLVWLLNYIRNRRFDNKADVDVTYGCAHFVTYDYERNVRDFYFQCIAGTKVASIMANGDIGACLDIERRKDLVQGNAYEDDFVNVWKNRFQVFRRDRSDLNDRCSGCVHKGVCMGDSAHTWDYDKNRPLYCLEILKKEGVYVT